MSAHERYAKIQESSRTQNAGMRKHEQKKEERTVAECRSLNGYSEKTGIMFFKYLMKLSRNAEVAEELTQETFFRAYMNYSALRDKTKVSIWLCQIAKNAYYAQYNEKKRTVPIEEPETLGTSESAEERYIQKELSQRAIECLNELEEPYKEVFMLSVFGALSFREISEAFGKSESWARVTFYRAKQKLSERLM